MENKKLKIGIDIDEVVVEFVKGYLEFLRKDCGLDFPFESIINYNFWETDLFDSKEEAIDNIRIFQETEEMENLNFVEGFHEAFIGLQGHELYFITSRPECIKKKTLNFFKKHFPEKEFSIFFSGDFFGGNKSKSEICNEIGIKIMVEDNPNYALDCAQKGIEVFLMNKPWNQNCEHENIIRVNNWNEIMEKLK